MLLCYGHRPLEQSSWTARLASSTPLDAACIISLCDSLPHTQTDAHHSNIQLYINTFYGCYLWMLLLLLHPFNGPLSGTGTTRVIRYQKGKNNLDFTEARDSQWQWHQLGHMQVCTSLQTDNHVSTPPLSFLQAGCPSCCPTNSVKALKTHCIHCKWFIFAPVCICTFPINWIYCNTSNHASRCVTSV